MTTSRLWYASMWYVPSAMTGHSATKTNSLKRPKRMHRKTPCVRSEVKSATKRPLMRKVKAKLKPTMKQESLLQVSSANVEARVARGACRVSGNFQLEIDQSNSSTSNIF